VNAPGSVVFLEMKPALREQLGLPELPFPVRRERLATVMSGEELRPDLLLDELDRFLAGRPELRGRYAAAGAALAYLAGVELGRRSFHPGALHCFEIGLALAPDNDSLRVNYALSLMAVGRQAEALRQLELVMAAHREAGVDPTIWTLAGRLCAELGDDARAARLLGEVAAFLPTEESFWELLAQVEERARAAGAPPAQAVVPATIPLATPLAPGKTAAPVRADCPNCRTALPAGARFCPQCGERLPQADE
jgi:tetratricopeptide (TPR) repeat protein